ncbi:hypothetical protein IH979_02555 [Patescibacteria group bacterium]|nr:hypothetical protein [Patescibacteria group bacterium]
MRRFACRRSSLSRPRQVPADGSSIRLARLPLAVGGLLSSQSADVVCRQLSDVRAAAHERLGCKLPYPFGTLSFLALPVIPELKITAQGMFDVVKQKFVE